MLDSKTGNTLNVGNMVGIEDGINEGDNEGTCDGKCEGLWVGGSGVGTTEGLNVG